MKKNIQEKKETLLCLTVYQDGNLVIRIFMYIIFAIEKIPIFDFTPFYIFKFFFLVLKLFTLASSESFQNNVFDSFLHFYRLVDPVKILSNYMIGFLIKVIYNLKRADRFTDFMRHCYSLMDNHQLENIRQVYKKTLTDIKEAKSKYNKSRQSFNRRLQNSSIRDLTRSIVQLDED